MKKGRGGLIHNGWRRGEGGEGRGGEEGRKGHLATEQSGKLCQAALAGEGGYFFQTGN
jgi:hypothetical protein